MGKLADLASVRNAQAESFVYVPPPATFDAVRILVKADLGYPGNWLVSVDQTVLGTVLRGLRRANPYARILVVEGASTPLNIAAIYAQYGLDDLLDDNMRAADAEELIMAEYDNTLPEPHRFTSMIAPSYLSEYECSISVSAFRRRPHHGQAMIQAALANLLGLFPRGEYQTDSPYERGQLRGPDMAQVLEDVYFSVGHLFDGAVVDLTHKYTGDDETTRKYEAVAVGEVVWGDDLLAVDEVACRLAGEPTAAYVKSIRKQRTALQKGI